MYCCEGTFCKCRYIYIYIHLVSINFLFVRLCNMIFWCSSIIHLSTIRNTYRVIDPPSSLFTWQFVYKKKKFNNEDFTSVEMKILPLWIWWFYLYGYEDFTSVEMKILLLRIWWFFTSVDMKILPLWRWIFHFCGYDDLPL